MKQTYASLYVRFNYFQIESNDRGDGFPFYYELNGISLGTLSEGI